MYHSEHWKDYCVGGVDGQRFHCANLIKDGDGGAVRSLKFAGYMCDGDNSAARLTEQGRYRVAVWKSGDGDGQRGNLTIFEGVGFAEGGILTEIITSCLVVTLFERNSSFGILDWLTK